MNEPKDDVNMSRLETKLDRILSIVESMDDKFKDHEQRLRSLETYVGHENLLGRAGFLSKVKGFFRRDPLGSTAAIVLSVVGIFYMIHNILP